MTQKGSALDVQTFTERVMDIIDPEVKKAKTDGRYHLYPYGWKIREQIARDKANAVYALLFPLI